MINDEKQFQSQKEPFYGWTLSTIEQQYPFSILVTAKSQDLDLYTNNGAFALQQSCHRGGG